MYTSDKANKILNYKNWTFKLNWASGVTLFTAITASVVFYNQNQSYKAKLDSLPALNALMVEQSKSITALQSSVETFNNVIKSFMDNPPSTLKAEIENLKAMNQLYHGSSFAPVNTAVAPTRALPNSIGTQ